MDIRKSAQAIGHGGDLLSNVVVNLDGQGLRVGRVPNILDARGSIGEDLIANAMFLGVIHTDLVNVIHLLDMLVGIGGEETGPPSLSFLEAGEREGFFESYFSEHGDGLVQR